MTFLDDLVNNDGRPRQVDASGFEVGRNLAATPGKVVFRNELMELIQYAPQTEQVHARPLLCSPPWINKYYVMDLAPGRSFIEWAVQHGRTVFAISYLNPSKDMGQHHHGRLPGARPADGAGRGPARSPAPRPIDIVGLCLGGALTAITAAYLTQAGDSRVGTLTLLNTMLDYAEPGVLGNFTDERTVEKLIKKIAKSGTLEGTSMAGTFDILRANDLIFNYVVSNWLMGQDPPSFDILAWNADSTRMPAAMHAFYLRNFYVRNKLAAGTLEIAGRTIDLSAIKSPTYVVSAINDHIVPWESAYKTVGAGRAARCGSCSAAAGTSPASSTRRARRRGSSRTTRRSARPGRRRCGGRPRSARPGTWWEDWARWVGETAGDMVDPPATGQRPVPGARRRARALRAHLTGRHQRARSRSRRHGLAGPLYAQAWVGDGTARDVAARLGGQLARQAAGGHGQRRRHGLQVAAEIRDRQLDRGDDVAARPEHRHRHARHARLRTPSGSPPPGSGGSR